MYVGDTYPDALLQVSDETGVLNLSAAVGITVKWEGKTNKFSGVGAAVQPPQADPDGIHQWNCRYVFAAGDTALPDSYVPYVVITWATGKIATYPTTDVLSVLAAPA